MVCYDVVNIIILLDKLIYWIYSYIKSLGYRYISRVNE